jgi:hypothetical protein
LKRNAKAGLSVSLMQPEEVDKLDLSKAAKVNPSHPALSPS